MMHQDQPNRRAGAAARRYAAACGLDPAFCALNECPQKTNSVSGFRLDALGSQLTAPLVRETNDDSSIWVT